jgi:hypothetical protein
MAHANGPAGITVKVCGRSGRMVRPGGLSDHAGEGEKTSIAGERRVA